MGRGTFDIDDQYVPGDHWLIDDRTGERIRKSESVQEWDGTIVRRDDAEPRHPQEYVRGRADRQAVRPTRPEAPDVYTGPTSVLTTADAAAGATFVLVESTSGFSASAVLMVALDNSDVFMTTIASIVAPDRLNLARPLPWAATTGALVTSSDPEA